MKKLFQACDVKLIHNNKNWKHINGYILKFSYSHVVIVSYITVTCQTYTKIWY